MRFFMAALSWLAFISGCRSDGETIQPQKKDLVQTVYASGKVFPLKYIKLSAKTFGYIQTILVNTGDTVTAGQPLLIIESPNNNLAVDIAETNLNYTIASKRENEMQLLAAEQDVRSAANKYSLDSTNLERYKNLWSNNISTRANLDQAQTQADLSYNNWLKAKAIYKNLYLKLSTEAALADKQVSIQNNSRKEYTIRAPFTGRIYDIPVKEGQLITQNMVAFTVGDMKKFEAWLDIDESDIGWIRKGQSILISCEAFQQTPIYTTVKEIEPSLAPGSKTVIVKADMPVDTLSYFSGMSAEANIIVNSRKNVWVVPAEYINENNQVMIKNGKEPIQVQTGIKDRGWVEIITGLPPGAVLIKP
jgi:RND family efflux transporter MFP subunit